MYLNDRCVHLMREHKAERFVHRILNELGMGFRKEPSKIKLLDDGRFIRSLKPFEVP